MQFFLPFLLIPASSSASSYNSLKTAALTSSIEMGSAMNYKDLLADSDYGALGA